MTTEDRRAIVVIHGIGEQKPMGTLRGFVDTLVAPLWNDSVTGKTSTDKPRFFSKPDQLSKLFELRRLTTPGTDKLPNTFNGCVS